VERLLEQKGLQCMLRNESSDDAETTHTAFQILARGVNRLYKVLDPLTLMRFNPQFSARALSAVSISGKKVLLISGQAPRFKKLKKGERLLH